MKRNNLNKVTRGTLIIGVSLLFLAFISFTGAGNTEKASVEMQKSINPAQSIGSGGTIIGRVIYNGGHVRKIKNLIKDEHTCGSNDIIDESLLTSEDGGLEWVVVSISSEIKDGKSLNTLNSERILNQKTCVFKPHVVLVGVNQPLVVINSDPTLHNVRTVSLFNDIVSRVQIAFPGSPVPKDTLWFNEPEIIETVCDVHGWMKAYIHVVEHPYYTITDENGSFNLTGVPPGQYTLKVWHETLGEIEQEVTVKDSQTAEATFYYSAKKN